MPKSSPKASDAFQQRQQLIAAACGGDADAQCRMGDLCRVGDEYTDQDYAEAVRWYRFSAEQGDANAQNNLGAMYEHGMAVPVNMTEALRWYAMAAMLGLSIAQFNLAECYLYGNGVDVDETMAAKLLHMAAEQGHIEAVTELGGLYLQGRGVEKRIATAAEMLTVAALEGDSFALGTLADNHDQIEADAKDGSVLSALCLAKMYDRGLGVEKDKAKMFAWLMWAGYKGSRDDDPDVREELADMREFYAAALDDTAQDEAWKLFGKLWSPNAIVVDNRPRDVDGNVIHDDAEYASALGEVRG